MNNNIKILVLEARIKELEEVLEPFAWLTLAIINSHPEGSPNKSDTATLNFYFVNPIFDGRGKRETGRALTNSSFINAYHVLNRQDSEKS